MNVRSAYRLQFAALMLWLPLLACGQGGGDGASSGHQSLKLEKFDGGFFTIEKPQGWGIVTAGHCGTFAFLIRDPGSPLRQIFFFGEIGPVYLSQQQKQIDHQYVNMGGYPSAWLDMPVVSPLTAGNFLSQLHLIAQTQVARQFMLECPRLENFHLVATTPSASPIQGAGTELVRGLFTKDGQTGEGLFMATVAPLLPSLGSPGGGIGCGFLVMGVTAPTREFGAMAGDLIRSLESFNLDPSYISSCMQAQNQAWSGVMKAGNTLREASDIIMEGWESRNQTHDILAQKWSDTTLDHERLVDVETGTVYEFDNGFYDNYDLNRERCEITNLQRLPDDDHDLWMQAPVDGRALTW
jgi:hypothetical protein